MEQLPEQRLSRLRELPETLKGQILNFLPITDAVKTVALRSFGNLWASSVGTLVFDAHDDRFAGDHDNRQFTQFVDGVLQRHQKPQIEKFELKFSPFLLVIPENGAGSANSRTDLCQETATIVDSWIWFALDKKVKVLDVGVHESDDGDGIAFKYEFPEFAFCCDSIEELHLSNIKLGRARGTMCISFENLKTMSLQRTRLGVSMIEAILDGCPNMESLELFKCLGVKKVECSSENLKHLTVVLHESFAGEPVKISGEHLVSLHLSGKIGSFMVEKVSSLVEVSLNIRNKPVPIRRILGDLNLLERVQEVTELTISGGSLLENICVFAPSPYQCPRHKSLILKNVDPQRHIPAILWLLKNTTNLENLSIYHDGTADDMLPDRICNFEEPIHCLNFHLKKIEVFGPIVSKPLFELLKYMFRMTNVLEEVVISLKWDEVCHWPNRAMPKALWKLYQKLSRLPKASNHVAINCKW